MERVGKEVVANDVDGNAELQGKGCNLPLKLDGHNMLGSPIMCASVSHDWRESSTSRTEDKDLSRCAVSLVGSEPPHTIPCSMSNTGNVIDELTVGNYGTPHLASVSSRDNNRPDKWQHMYWLPCGSRYEASQGDYAFKDNNKMLLRAGEQLMKTQSDLRNFKPWLTKRIEHETREMPACLRASNKKIKSNNTLPNRDTALKTLSTPSFSQPLVKKAWKGKGVAFRNQEDPTEFGSAIADPIENLGYARKVASDALVRSSANNDQLSLHRIDRFDPESLHHGISLREWLKPGCHRRDKVESLLIFRQIVELVNLAHSQGAAFQDLRPSCFNIFHDLVKNRPLEEDIGTHSSLVAKQQKLGECMKSLRHQSQLNSSCGLRTKAVDKIDFYATGPRASGYVELHSQNHSSNQSSCMRTKQQSISSTVQLEEKWYRSPEERNKGHSTFSSNIYNLGVLLFEVRRCGF